MKTRLIVCRSMLLGILLLLASLNVEAETFTTTLTGSQEVPASGSGATGYARIFLDEGAGMITFTVVYSGLSSTQVSAHIHGPAPIGTNGGVIITLGSPGGTSNTITGSAAITPTQIAMLRSNQAYVNVHSTNFPGGEIRGQLAQKRPLDYDGDGRTDYSVLRFPTGPCPNPITYYNRNSTGPAAEQTILWGDACTDFPAPGDYDGDGKDDFCLYRAGASAGQQSYFLLLRSSDSTVQFIPWGVFGDQAVARDFDGDGKTDPAIFRRGASSTDQTVWWILRSSDSSAQTMGFGLTGNGTTSFDTPIPADYDGDGKSDIAVYRFGLSPANNSIVMRSSDSVVTFTQWGNFNTDYIAPGDYDGDGKYEIAAVRTGASSTSPMVWWIRQSSDGGVRAIQFGITSDRPTQGDYDGDGKTDISVWRPMAAGSQSTFYYIGSFDNSFHFNSWGLNNDFPVNSFDAR